MFLPAKHFQNFYFCAGKTNTRQQRCFDPKYTYNRSIPPAEATKPETTLSQRYPQRYMHTGKHIFGLCCPFTVMSCLGGQIPARGLVASGLMHAPSLEPIFRVLGSYCRPYHGTAVWSRDYKSCRLYKRYNCTTGHLPGCCF